MEDFECWAESLILQLTGVSDDFLNNRNNSTYQCFRKIPLTTE